MSSHCRGKTERGRRDRPEVTPEGVIHRCGLLPCSMNALKSL